jgi:hypothetical protein
MRTPLRKVDQWAKLNIVSTPTFFLGTVSRDERLTVHRRLNGVRPVEEFQAAVELVQSELATAGAPATKTGSH